MFRYILVFVVALAISAPATATVRTVPGQFPTIQKAIDASSAGDTVLVSAGTYTDCTHHPASESGTGKACVVMKSGVKLIGSGADVTIIDANLLGMGIYCRDVTNALVQGFKVIDASDKDWTSVTGYGPGFYCWASSPTVRDCTFGPNTDGGVNCRSNSPVALIGCVFENNSAKAGGGLHIEGGSTVTAEGCTFQGNAAPIGGAIFINQSSPVFEDCEITDNTVVGAGNNGGGVLAQLGSPVFRHCTFEGNTSGGNGGGLCVIECAGEIEACTVRDNDVTGDNGQGGGILFLQNSTMTVDSTTIVHNSVSGDLGEGGGIYCRASTVTITNCTLSHNWIVSGGSKGETGGIHCYGACAPVIERTIIALSTVGAALGCESGANPQVSCCDFYGNAGGNTVCGTNLGGNFSADPLFCDAPAYIYGVSLSSPCAPGNHPSGPETCGGALIGAGPLGCFGDVEDEGEWLAPTPLLATHAPNPFQASTTIEFALAEPARVTLRVYDVTGREVASLGDCPMSAGTHRVTWDGTTGAGARAVSGVYFYRLTVGSRSQTGRMVMVQ